MVCAGVYADASGTVNGKEGTRHRMKILLLTFSISNGGDFLIEERMHQLLCKLCPAYEIVKKEGLNVQDVKELNEYDVIVSGGGPYFEPRIIEDAAFSLFHMIEQIRRPVYFIGSGCYGACGEDEYVYSRKLPAESCRKLQRISKTGGVLGARDTVSLSILKNNGVDSVVLTGCPAWYDLQYLDSTDINGSVDLKNIRRIIISDPGVTKEPGEQMVRAEQAIAVINYLKERFHNAELIFTFNNGIQTKYSSVCNNRIREFLSCNEISYSDLSYSAEKFSAYDRADLHVGFRVHSHIYALSHRIPSLLIEEDLRGYGMNEVLGLPHLVSYSVGEILQNQRYQPNPYLIPRLNHELDILLESKGRQVRSAFRQMKEIFYQNFLPMMQRMQERK